MNIAIIPARGGSKRLPGKNIKLLAGKPLIAWTIEAALESKVFDYVFVSTDDDEIAAVAKKFGAEVPFLRPTQLATDEATTNDVVTHLVEWFENKDDRKVSTVAILQPTSPIRNSLHIKESMILMKETAAKAVVSVCKLEHPIQLCNKLGPEGSMEGFIDSKNMKRTQDYDEYHRLNGAIYLFIREYVGRLDSIYSKGTNAYIMESEMSIDIDEDYDFKLAEFLIGREL